MEINKIQGKVKEYIGKYKYAALVLVIGLVLLLLPTKSIKTKTSDTPQITQTGHQNLTQDSLVEILQSIQGAGKVKVLLSMATGEETVYQSDTEASSGDSSNKTVIITDSQRKESGLIRQINPAAYQGAIVVCEGADNPTVRLAITQAVSKITGLGADAICVLKMQ